MPPNIYMVVNGEGKSLYCAEEICTTSCHYPRQALTPPDLLNLITSLSWITSLCAMG
ncbi:uncharacterized protein LACBIDRAFT_308672 [Laccaria bicolor S238N-H82]|uniref:Predicted protein n=1 Tax=Laccaria bicolor (strain S238N-H82 / ATCC MYA-4686) TaxID=486041 RepID=B0CWX2_LACBS|nr:uncharacterized protein LACBIDRAFT_308672 [Laccaria bicolor S238N-H82]EDR13581.1 predicted protein [Laccaria bicolor S238N-H82]|eukprot:XP_001876079.1 predicted protein [Laccaria bicolor S238N-H82]